MVALLPPWYTTTDPFGLRAPLCGSCPLRFQSAQDRRWRPIEKPSDFSHALSFLGQPNDFCSLLCAHLVGDDDHASEPAAQTPQEQVTAWPVSTLASAIEEWLQTVNVTTPP